MTTPRQRASQVGRKARSCRHGKAYVRTNRLNAGRDFLSGQRATGALSGAIALVAPAGFVEKDVVPSAFSAER